MVKKNKTEISNKSKKTKGKTKGNKSQIDSTKTILKSLLYSQKPETNEKEYTEKRYSDYITKMFNSSIINMLIVYISRNKDKLKKYGYDQEQNFINKFANLIKELYLNEIELAYLTLLLDRFGWNFNDYEHWDYFYCLGLYSKKKVSGEIESDSLLSNKAFFEDKYISFVNEQEFEDFEQKGISNKDLNERFKELTKPINSYCRKNFINYSGIADKIVRLSQPYGMESNGNQLIYEKNLKNDNDVNNDNLNKLDDNDFSKVKLSNINDVNNIDYNKINNLVSSFPYNIRNINSGYNQRTAFSNVKNDLNLETRGSQLSLGRQKSGFSIGSNAGSSFHPY